MPLDPTLPSFLTGGQLNTTESGKAGAPFSPTSSTDQPKLNVVAPLDVTAAPTQAAALARALNIGWKMAEPVLEKKAAKQGEEDAAIGSLDALTGNVDPVKQAQIEGYRIGAARTQVEQHTVAAIQDAHQLAATDWAALPLSDANGNKGLLSTMDDFFRSRLAGLEKDPEAAKIVAPMLQHALNEMAGTKVRDSIAQTRQGAADVATALAMHAAQSGDGSFKWSEQFDKLTQVYGGDRHAASTALVQAVGEAAVQAHKPSIIDTLLPQSTTLADGQQIAGPGSTPENASYLDSARRRATSLQNEDIKQSNEKVAASITNQVLSGKDPTALLHAYLGQPGADPAFARSTLDWFKSLSRQNDADQLDTGAAANITVSVAKGDISSTAQLVTAAQSAGITGKALSQLIKQNTSLLATTQAVDQNDPAYRDGRSWIERTYKPATDQLGRLLHPAAGQQQADAMREFSATYQKLLTQGKSSIEAAATATNQVIADRGKPMEQAGSDNIDTSTPYGRVQIIKDGNPKVLKASGLTGSDIKALVASGQITDEQGRAAVAAILH
jgi:hypothetical protein